MLPTDSPSLRRRAALLLLVLAVAAGAPPHLHAAPAEIRNSIGMAFVQVPAGQFRMGSDEAPAALAVAYPAYDPERFLKIGDETPVHVVQITKPFYLGKHEVTVGQFRKFVTAAGYRAESEADGTGAYGYNRDYDPATSPRGDAFEGRNPKYSWRNPGFPQDDAHPVLNVTYNDALALAAWLSASEGKTYRLPTEAEWEYACRAGGHTRYGNGDDPHGLTEIANIFDRDSALNWPRWRAFALPLADGFAFTAPVGSFRANAFGLHDMHGNAWEWVHDWYAADTYGKSPPADPRGPDAGQQRVRRGGSWHSWSFYTRCSYRNWNRPDTRYTLVGMRLVREVD